MESKAIHRGILLLGMLVMPGCTSAPSHESESRAIVGGVEIVIPTPNPEMVRLAKSEMTRLPGLEGGRLIASFAPSAGAVTANTPKFFRSASVGVMRIDEERAWSASKFRNEFEPAPGHPIEIRRSSVSEALRSLEKTLESFEGDNLGFQSSEAVDMGIFFYWEDSYGFGLAVATFYEGEVSVEILGAALIRVNSRLLILQIYAEYEDRGTIEWVGKTLEGWVDSVQNANPE